MNFKDIHIGNLISQRVTERQTESMRICNFLKCNEEKIAEMYISKTLDTDILLRWSKLLEYDFFRVYSQHLILYAPSSKENEIEKNKSSIPQFRKKIYTKEVIDFILSQINSGIMTKNQVIEEYKIPKTTLYKWISKYGK